MNRSAKGLLIVTTNFDGFSLANQGRTHTCTQNAYRLPGQSNFKQLVVSSGYESSSVVSWDGKQILAYNLPQFYRYTLSMYAPTTGWIAI